MSFVEHLGTLEDKFQLLDQIPEELYVTIVTHSHGDLNRRIEGILQWRDAFLNGFLPDEEALVWPELIIRRMILKRLEVLEIVQYCNDQTELTDSILKDICEAIGSAEQWQEIDPGFDDKLARDQKQRDRDSPFNDPSSNAPDSHNSDSTSGEMEHTGESDTGLENDTDLKNDTVDTSFPETALPETVIPENSLPENSLLEDRWLELAQQWQQLESVFSELSGFLGRGWDLTQGLLASQGWRDIIRYRKLVRELPWLEQVIASLGRLKEKNSEESESQAELIFEPVRRIVDEEVDVPTPYAVYETSGIRRSDDISRILPGELAQLGHPQLNLLWHAKRAEHTLLTYQVEGVLSEHEPVEREVLEEILSTRPETQKGYGPIIVCLDSSASMQGEPENIAKALVLEALQIAWQEDRACYVYLFSGPEQILEHNLDLTRGGLAELLDFLTRTFQGGTDVIKPLIQAMTRQKQEKWQESDILLVSDGRFPVTPEQKKQIKQMRNHSKKHMHSRIHGVLIGNWQGSGLQEICDCLHRI